MMQFKGTPLFGKDSSPSHTSSVISLIGTFVFWLIFLICSFFIKPLNKKPKYKEVQIVLSSTPEQKKVEEKPAPAQLAPAPAASEPILEKNQEVTNEQATSSVKEVKTQPKTEVSKVKTEPKKSSQKKEVSKPVEKPVTKSVNPEPTAPVLYEDPMEKFNRQIEQKPKKEFDWSKFDDTPVQEEPQAAPQKIKSQDSDFSGNAGTIAEQSATQKQTSTNQTTNKEQDINKKTTDALGKIENTSFKGISENGVESEVAVKSSLSSNGKIMMEMADGTQRALIEPSEPKITLSDAAAKTIDGSRKVIVEFFVNEQGHVPYSDIDITPESLLSEKVVNEIRTQISQWRFEPANYSSIAKFEYSIIKK